MVKTSSPVMVKMSKLTWDGSDKFNMNRMGWLLLETFGAARADWKRPVMPLVGFGVGEP